MSVNWRELGAVKRERAAEILGGVSIRSVDDLLRSGELHACRLGKRGVLVAVHSLRAYLGEVQRAPAFSAPAVPEAELPTRLPRAELPPRSRKILAEARRRMGMA